MQKTLSHAFPFLSCLPDAQHVLAHSVPSSVADSVADVLPDIAAHFIADFAHYVADPGDVITSFDDWAGS